MKPAKKKPAKKATKVAAPTPPIELLNAQMRQALEKLSTLDDRLDEALGRLDDIATKLEAKTATDRPPAKAPERAEEVADWEVEEGPVKDEERDGLEDHQDEDGGEGEA